MHFGSSDSCISREAGHLMGPCEGLMFKHHHIVVSSSCGTLPAFPTVKPYVAVIMLGCHHCFHSNAL